MAAEKACKAHLAANGGHDQVKKSHAYVGKVLPTLARQFVTRENAGIQLPGSLLSEIKRLAHEVEVLAPARDDGGAREDNTEYPWQDAQGNLCIPCEYKFQNLDDNNRSLVYLVKLIRKAAKAYAK